MRMFALVAGGVVFAAVVACLAPSPARGAGARDGAGGLSAGTASLQPNVNEFIWVVEGGPEKRLALYRIESGGKSLHLVDVRQIDYDLRIVQLSRDHPTVEEVKKGIEKPR